MAREKTWALVSDGMRALLLPDLETGAAPPSQEIVSDAESPHLRDILSDRPGRSFSSGDSGRRSAMVPGSDPVLRDMQDFARKIMRRLVTYQRKGHLTRLAVFAAPRMLGVLRQEMPAAVQQAVIFERDANLMTLPADELRQNVLDTLSREVSHPPVQ